MYTNKFSCKDSCRSIFKKVEKVPSFTETSVILKHHTMNGIHDSLQSQM